jgi:soluble lytic murein transglycosylase-like protein
MFGKLTFLAAVLPTLVWGSALLSGPAAAQPAPVSAFGQEQQMGFAARMHRWDPLISEASSRFGVSEKWIRIVMQVESGGRTMLGEKQPIVSRAGAMGLMQLMPSTWRDMRAELRLGPDPFAPRDNVLAGAAYLRWLKDKYGYPAMFAAYNDGPGHLEMRLQDAGLLPAETRTYVARVTAAIEGRAFIGGFADTHAKPVRFTKPNGLPVWIKPAEVISIRTSFPDEYAPGVKSVIGFGRVRQGVCESLADVKAKLHLQGNSV